MLTHIVHPSERLGSFWQSGFECGRLQVYHNETGAHVARYELTDEQYALIAPELPTNDGKTGHPYHPHRPIINGIFWRLLGGAAWPDIPERYGNWKTIYDR